MSHRQWLGPPACTWGGLLQGDASPIPATSLASDSPHAPSPSLLGAGKRKSPAYSAVSGTILRSSLATGVAIGAFAGFLYAYQSSAGRLMGFFPNEKEVSTAAAQQ